jgi:tetrapyrrole methylase family protein/MazG family protein
VATDEALRYKRRPMSKTPVDTSSYGEAFAQLCQVMERLRAPDGCPWDRVQTMESLKPYLLEETYEVLHALDLKDVKGHREELGDLIFQVVFHAKVRSEEEGGFNVADVCNAIRDKQVRRHPHVFGKDAGTPQAPTTSDAVLMKWEQLKRAERNGASVLSGVPPTLPALLRAQRVGEKAARVGFDWKDPRGVLAKVKEEVAELEEALNRNHSADIRHEMGDVLFSVAQLARFVNHSAEDALRETIERFSRRFMHLEEALRVQGKTPETCSMDELEALWQQAKAAEKQGAA